MRSIAAQEASASIPLSRPPALPETSSRTRVHSDNVSSSKRVFRSAANGAGGKDVRWVERHDLGLTFQHLAEHAPVHHGA